ncbi:lytic transglycosylase domain-containing protein [Taibaiella lutea]|uniref:Lytic transglycosylase domain-containing protein n=1 Tax=Taibaiella lutea TaxID=2608001 RepID=A0A5M6CPG4_9BACT|nr:lytic transglycosylase domain-containing protein [Taibaiella lutea]KAA5536300.1 lytic transglycosylase domain-containing protein [Taibaiella lutea]
MERKIWKTASLGFLIGTIFVAGLSFVAKDSNSPVEVTEDGSMQYKWYPPKVPKSMSFAGEKVPLERWEIKERLDRELLINYYAHGGTLYVLKLSTRVFPIIEKILKQQGVPEDFKYLCVAESSLQNPTSPAGAIGYWQFMTATGKQYGLVINDEVDERYNLEKSTIAACKYLNAAYAKFGSWTAAAASYNCGSGGYSNQSDFQMSKNYYDLLLPEETNRYVFRILALKQIIGNAAKYGFILPEEDAYKPVATVNDTITATVDNFAQYAFNKGTNYKMLKILNPWLRDRKLTLNAGDTVIVQLPATRM